MRVRVSSRGLASLMQPLKGWAAIGIYLGRKSIPTEMRRDMLRHGVVHYVGGKRRVISYPGPLAAWAVTWAYRQGYYPDEVYEEVTDGFHRALKLLGWAVAREGQGEEEREGGVSSSEACTSGGAGLGLRAAD